MRSSTRVARAIAVLLLALGTLAWPLSARAATFLANGQVTITQGQTIDDDVYAFSGTITIDGRITRSLVVAGGTVTINGQVEGDVAFQEIVDVRRTSHHRDLHREDSLGTPAPPARA